MHPLWSGVVHGEAASKANSRKMVINPKTRKPMFIKSEKALNWMQCAGYCLQSIKPRELITVKLAAVITLYYATERPDTDPSLVFDALQEFGIIKNDRQIRDHMIFHAIDKASPRVDIALYERDSVRFVVEPILAQPF